MDGYRYYGSGKRYYVTNHALGGPGARYEERRKYDAPPRYGHARQWSQRRSVDGERHNGRNVYDIAEECCYMADIEFNPDGTVMSVRYDLVRPARKA